MRLLLLVTLTVPSALAGQLRAFTGATLIDGTSRAPLANATLVIRDGRVIAAGPSATVQIPAGAERVDLAGKFVIPGLINAHGHVNAARELRSYAMYGTTTVFSLGGEADDVFEARTQQGAPSLERSRVFVSGPVLSPATPDEARTQVAAVVSRKVDFVKIRVDDNLGTATKMPPEVYRAVIDEAHRRGARVAAHLFYLADAKALLDAGADLVAHSIRDAEADEAVIAQLKARNTCVVPTLMREVSTFVYESTPAWFDDPLFRMHPDQAQVPGSGTPRGSRPCGRAPPPSATRRRS